MPPLPPEPPPPPEPTRAASAPFVKPNFTSLDDLLSAFATHATDDAKGTFLLPMEGCSNIDCAPQPLVFVHTLGA